MINIRARPADQHAGVSNGRFPLTGGRLARPDRRVRRSGQASHGRMSTGTARSSLDSGSGSGVLGAMPPSWRSRASARLSTSSGRRSYVPGRDPTPLAPHERHRVSCSMMAGLRWGSLFLGVAVASLGACGDRARDSSDGGTGESGEADTGDSADPKYCATVDDCVPVGCGCYCSGCGGFSYEDVVNAGHHDAWYEQHDCEPPMYCIEVCCPAVEITCESNLCGVEPG